MVTLYIYCKFDLLISDACVAHWIRRLPPVPSFPGSNLGGNGLFFVCLFFIFILLFFNLLFFFFNLLFFLIYLFIYFFNLLKGALSRIFVFA